MESSATSQLELLLTIPPQDFVGHHNPHTIAHAALGALQENGDKQFLFLRTILEKPQSEELLFHCITGCRHAILTRWEAFSVDFTSTIRDFFLAMGDHYASKSIRLACFTTSVAFWKRQWNETKATIGHVNRNKPSMEEQQIMNQIGTIPRLDTKKDLFQYLAAHMSTHMEATCEFISTLVGEFSGKSVVSYRLPMEFHKEAYKAFEKENLEECLRISMGAMTKVVGTNNSSDPSELTITKSVVQCTIDIIGWEFGGGDWMHLPSSQTLIRPPSIWNQYLIQPSFIGGIFTLHERNLPDTDLSHKLRQLLLLMCSLSGPIFRQKEEKIHVAQFLCEGTRTLPALFQRNTNDESLIYDVFSLVCKLLTNFRLEILSALPSFVPLLDAIAATGTFLLQANLRECESADGDLLSLDDQDWREEAIGKMTDSVALLCQDPWLIDSKSDHDRKEIALRDLKILSPLYSEFVRCRTRTTYLTERWIVKDRQDCDEDKENIEALAMEEELKVVACLGRLYLPNALATLASAFQDVAPRLQSVWRESDGSTPDDAAVLKECSLLLKYCGHLLSAENKRNSTFRVPPSIELACSNDEENLNSIAFLIRGVLSLMNVQATNVSTSPSNLRLSSDLSCQFLWFLKRWVPLYVCAVVDDKASAVLLYWSAHQTAQEVVSFCIWLCSQYLCFLPQESRLQEGVADFLATMAKGNPRLRSLMVASSHFHQMVIMECLCMRPCQSLGDLGAAVSGGNLPVSVNMLQGCYCRPIEAKSHLLTALLVASGDSTNETSNQIFNACLKSVQETYMAFLTSIEAQSPDSRILAQASVSLFGEVANAASGVSDSGRIPIFLTPIFPRLTTLMEYFADDRLICEGLLRLFRDYAKLCLSSLTPEQTSVLLEATSNLLAAYSKYHCNSRRVVRPKTGQETKEEEEQAYSDILCTVELLTDLARGSSSITSPIAIEVVFFGLQQIIPLMTQGLLTYPQLCYEYFSLVGSMMEEHADKIFALPYGLIDTLIQSLLAGSSHHDTHVAKKCLNGIQGLATAQLKTGRSSFNNNKQKIMMEHHPNLFERCIEYLLRDVVFQQVIFDRMEATSDALLMLIAIDQKTIVLLVHEMGLKSSSCCPSQSQGQQQQQQHLLDDAVQKLIQQEIIKSCLKEGWEGRANRRQFKEGLEDFVKTANSVLVVK